MSVPQTKIYKPDKSEENPEEFKHVADRAMVLKGMVYLTILQWVPDRQVMKRVYSTDPVRYPTGGEKVMPLDAAWPQTVIVNQQPHCTWNRAETEGYYNDAADIFSSGATAILCVPVVSDSGTTYGALNFCGHEDDFDQSLLAEMQRLAATDGKEAFDRFMARN